MYRETHGALEAALASERRAHAEARRELEAVREAMAQSELASRYAEGRVRAHRWWVPASAGVLIIAGLAGLAGYAVSRRSTRAEIARVHDVFIGQRRTLAQQRERIASLVQQRDLARADAKRVDELGWRAVDFVSRDAHLAACRERLARPGVRLVCLHGGRGYRKGRLPKCFAAFRLERPLELQARALTWAPPQRTALGSRTSWLAARRGTPDPADLKRILLRFARRVLRSERRW